MSRPLTFRDVAKTLQDARTKYDGWHTHRCGCGTEWKCTKPLCNIDNLCTECDERQFAAWAAREEIR